MFQQAIKYNVQMTYIFLRLYDLEIKNKQIIEKKDRSFENLSKVLEKEQKLKAELQGRYSENSQILAKLQAARQNINNMGKQNKDLENIKQKGIPYMQF